MPSPLPAPARAPIAAPVPVEVDEAVARRELRRQVAELDRRLSDVVLSGFPGACLDAPSPASRGHRGPRLLGLGELEAVRDELAGRLATASRRLDELGERRQRARVLLEEMLRDPAHHRGVRIANHDLGERGCGVWQVRPRLGLVGVLAGWWEVKLSSGCPRAT